ncbi:hypothetical protein VP01_3357g2 [Puccinia sorghi]|uniref:Uncharacterized protein n=1 Tax=Puccinia sorghi TaxID=27349 RepID=A0A0L6UX31_9BASI|nr:hypothetical protein VP01_3357g2 [Puccinia sorghi]
MAKNHESNLLVASTSSCKIKKVDIEKVQKNEAAEIGSNNPNNILSTTTETQDTNQDSMKTYVASDPPKQPENWLKKEKQLVLDSSCKMKKNYPYSKTHQITPSLKKTLPEKKSDKNHESNFLVASTSGHKIKNTDVEKLKKDEAPGIGSNDSNNESLPTFETQDKDNDSIKNYLVPDPPKQPNNWVKKETQWFLDSSNKVKKTPQLSKTCQITPSIKKTLAEEKLPNKDESNFLLAYTSSPKIKNMDIEKLQKNEAAEIGSNVPNNKFPTTVETQDTNQDSIKPNVVLKNEESKNLGSKITTQTNQIKYSSKILPVFGKFWGSLKRGDSVNKFESQETTDSKRDTNFHPHDFKQLSLENVIDVKYLKAIRDGSLLRQFSDDEICLLSDASMKEIVSDWKRMHLPKWPILLFAHHLKLNNRDLHVPLELNLTNESYNLFLLLWSQGHHQFEKLEIESSKFINEFEFKRRLHAFRHLLHSHTLAASWDNWRKSSNLESHELDGFEPIFGLSNHYLQIDQIPILLGTKLYFFYDKWDKSHPQMKIKDILQSALGKYEAQKRKELYDYFLRGRYFKTVWWDADKLEEDRKKYGLDILVILKVGDALQFGAKSYDVRGTLNSSHKNLIQIMTDKSGPFPWVESPERAWIYRNHGEVYVHRLKYLRSVILKFAKQDRTMLINRIIPFLANEIGTGILESPIYHIGYELTWCDMGLKLEDLKEFWLARNHKGNPLKIKNFSQMLNGFSTKERQAVAEWHSKFVLVDHPVNKSISLKQTVGQKFLSLFT